MSVNRRPVPRLALALMTAILLGAGGVASAEPTKDPAVLAQAKKHFLAARDLMGKGKYELAAAEYTQAFELTGDPVLKYNIGNALEKAEKWGPAIEAYQAYVEGKPEAKDHDAVVAKIEELKAKLPATGPGPGDTTVDPDFDTPPPDGTGDGNTTLEPGLGDGTGTGTEPASEPAPRKERSRGYRTAAWLSVGLAAALLTTGGVLALSARSRADDLERLQAARLPDGRPLTYDGTTKSQYEELEDEGDTLSTLSIVFFGAAAVATGAAVTFFILDPGGSSEAAAPNAAPIEPPVTIKMRPLLSPTTAGVGATVTF
ncbi:MAG: hypothetical protein IT370_29120 [Deltaproteobacteria bacterium]|nr:hypothetical protein [Deltaproteobacteria bacterium]